MNTAYLLVRIGLFRDLITTYLTKIMGYSVNNARNEKSMTKLARLPILRTLQFKGAV